MIGIAHSNLESERKSFINALIEYRKIKDHEIVVVFDGWKGGKEETTTIVENVKVIFSGIGERADDLIKRTIAKKKRKWIVISSDRDIINYAWSLECVPVNSEMFEEKMSEAIKYGMTEENYRNDEEDIYEDDTGYFRKKGNPRKPSQKEKLIKSALDKL